MHNEIRRESCLYLQFQLLCKFFLSVLYHFTLFPNSRKAKLTKHRIVKLAPCFCIKTESLLTGITHYLHNANDLSHREGNLALYIVNVAVFTDRL